MTYEEVAGNGTMLAWDVGCFLTLPKEGSYNITFFSNLFGHDGIAISYPGARSEQERTTFNDYYYINGKGVPVLLARAYGTPTILDLDGNGDNELAADAQIFFQRNSQVIEADLPTLLENAWPDMNAWDYAVWDTNGRCLTIRGFVTMPGWGDGSAYFKRYLYYNGENLLIYKSGAAVDHVMKGIVMPDDVLSPAKSRALKAYQATKNGDEGALKDQSFDNWRITALDRVSLGAASAEWPISNIEVYRFSYQFHTTKPENVTVAGGAYVDEEGWFGGYNTKEGPYLVFQVRNGQRVLLGGDIPGDASIDSPAFKEALLLLLKQNGLQNAVQD